MDLISPVRSRADIDRLRSELLSLHRGAWQFPAACAVLTVGCGVYYYDSGNFWNAFDNLTTPADCSWWGEQFELFIALHESLETFDYLGGHRFVAPILAHGGIPQNCLPDFFEAITSHGDSDYSGQELLDQISSHPGWVAITDKPVRRFLEHGGEVAEDFVGRFLDLWRAYNEGDFDARSGLPDRVVAAFSDWYSKHRPRKRSHHDRFPRPELHLEPAGAGVFLRLPKCSDHPGISDLDSWEVLGGRWATTREHDIACQPSEKYEAQCKGRRFVIPGLDPQKPLLFFDSSSGRSITDPKQRRIPEHVWVVAPLNSTFEPAPNAVEGLTRWPLHEVVELDLANTSVLKALGDRYEVRRPFFILGDSLPIPNVTSSTGLPVFASPPAILWEGQANLSLSKDGKLQGNIDITAEELGILFDRIGDYDITLRGPLGHTFRTRFILALGFECHTYPSFFSPTTRTIEWRIRSSAGKVHALDGSEPPFRTDDSVCDFYISDYPTEIHLVALAPELKWRFLGSKTHQELSNKQLATSTTELLEVDYPLLEVSSGQAACDFEILLHPRHTTSRTIAPKRKRTFPSNAWYFDLRAVRDDLLSLGAPDEYELVVTGKLIDEHRLPMLAVRPPWTVNALKVEGRIEANDYLIKVTWRESGDVVPGRWIVLISAWHVPRTCLVAEELTNDARGVLELRVRSDEIRPGRYFVRAVHAPWGSDNWAGASASAQTHIDLCTHRWSDFFSATKPNQIEEAREALLAYWCRPDLVRSSPVGGSSLTAAEVSRLIEGLVLEAQPTGNRMLNAELRRLVLLRPLALIAVLAKHRKAAELWARVLPPLSIIALDATKTDKAFLCDVAFQYNVLRTAGRIIKRKYAKKRLSDPLRIWCDHITKVKPPAYDVVWLCERFAIFDQQRGGARREYEVNTKGPVLQAIKRAL